MNECTLQKPFPKIEAKHDPQFKLLYTKKPFKRHLNVGAVHKTRPGKIIGSSMGTMISAKQNT